MSAIKQRPLVKAMRWAARVIGLGETAFLIFIVLLAWSWKPSLLSSSAVVTAATIAVALAGCIISWWRVRLAGVLLIATSLGLVFNPVFIRLSWTGYYYILDYLMFGLPMLVAGVLFLLCWWLSRKTSSSALPPSGECEFMRILGREISIELMNYYEVCLREADCEPSWRSDNSIPFGKIRWRRWEGEHTPVIIINLELPQPVFENIVAHELGHLVQFSQGYPQVLSRRGMGLGSIASSIIDLVTDPDSERRLKPYGLWNSYRIDKAYEELIKVLPKATAQADVDGTNYIKTNAINYAYAKSTFSEKQWGTAKELFNTYLPRTSGLGEILFSTLPDGVCDNETKARESCLRIFEELEIGQYLKLYP